MFFEEPDLVPNSTYVWDYDWNCSNLSFRTGTKGFHKSKELPNPSPQRKIRCPSNIIKIFQVLYLSVQSKVQINCLSSNTETLSSEKREALHTNKNYVQEKGEGSLLWDLKCLPSSPYCPVVQTEIYNGFQRQTLLLRILVPIDDSPSRIFPNI